MSTGLSSSNPIVLFGNIGPDVVKVSQIYNPDNDQYTVSMDVVAQPGKSYYIRSYENRTIKFTQVTPVSSGDRPRDNGWYEENAGHADQTGKYVPAPKSLVVCDIDYGDFKARSILIVDTVDDQGENPTFKSTLVPTTNGQDKETSARLVDFGNDRFMLYIEPSEEYDDTLGCSIIRVCPDRKLMLYGERHYAYELCDIKGNSLAVPRRELVGNTSDALIPYSGETTSAFTLDNSSWDGNVGKFFTSVVSGGYHRSVIIPDRNSSVRCKTLDTVYQPGQTYFVEEWLANGERTFRPLTQGTDYTTASGHNTVGIIKDTATNQWVNVGANRIYVNAAAFLGPGSGNVYQGFITTVNPNASVRYPERAYLRAGVELASGQPVIMNVYEYEGDAYRMVLIITLIARIGTVLDASETVTKQVDSFDVIVRNDEDDVLTSDGETPVYYLPVGQNVNGWSFHPIIRFNDGSYVEVPIDRSQTFVYGLENIHSENAGRQFNVLFKHFVTAESPIRENFVKNFLTKRIIIEISDGSSTAIRKVSTIPLWNYAREQYEFRFLPYRADYECPELVAQGRIFENASVLGFTAAAYQDPNGNIKALDVVNIGKTDGNFIHARLAVTAKLNGYSTDVYRQYVALRLQSWTRNQNAVKWLIGEYTVDATSGADPVIEEYTPDEVPYGSAAVGTRPFISCSPDTAPNGMPCYKMIIPSFFENVNRFLNNFYRNAYIAPADIKGRPDTEDTGSLLNDVNRFRLRSVASADIFEPLSSPTALEGVVYYRTNGSVADGVVPGKTVVTKFSIKVQEELSYFVYNSSSEKYEQVLDLAPGAIITGVGRENLFIRYTKPIVTKWVEISSYFAAAREALMFEVDSVPVYDSSYYATNMPGGPIPTVVGENLGYNTQVMGLVIVEFANYDGETGVYKYVYGVPVEVMFPYVPTTDMYVQPDKKYYKFIPADQTGGNGFVEVTDLNPGDQIPLPADNGMQLWEAYVPVTH